MKKIKTIRSHVGIARLLAECNEVPIGEIPRQNDIPSPYAYSPTETIWDMGGRRIFWKETSHKVYEVYEIPADMTINDFQE